MGKTEIGFSKASTRQWKKLPVIKSNVSVISIQDGAEFKKNSWTLAPEAKPDVYEAILIDGKPRKITFITDVESISFNELGLGHPPHRGLHAEG
jgi:hypothetical protein